MALLLGVTLSAQTFSPTDTVTEYPMKGTMYHNKFEGRKTSHGDIFDHNLFTAAHHKFKFGTLLLVTNKNTGLTVIVKVNDRCPKKGILDMTRRAAWAIGIKGCQPVKVRVLPPSYEEQWASQRDIFDSVPSTRAKGKYAVSNYIKKGGVYTPKDGKGESLPKSSVKTTEQPNNSSTKVSEKKSGKAHQTATQTQTATSSELYNLWLGTVQTHGEAFELISKLPDIYQEKAIIDTPLGDEQLDILLDVKLPKGKAQELNRALKHSFPNCKIIPLE